MALTSADVLRLARLARLALEPEAVDRMRHDLEHILAFVGELAAADTAGIEPMAHAVDVVQRLREDVVSEVDRRDEFLALAPEAEAGLYLVPKVIE